MSLGRVGRLAGMALASLVWVACGQVYRPVVIPCSEQGVPGCPVETPPTPANFHAVFGLTANVRNNPGGVMQIDVAGDTIIAETPIAGVNVPKTGWNPTHAALLPNNSKVFVASAGSVAGGLDGVLSFTPVSQFSSGFGPVTAPSLPSQSSSITSISEDINNNVTVTLSAPLSNVQAGYWIVITGVVIPPCSPSPCTSLPQNAYDGGFAISSINTAGTVITYVNSTPGLPALSSGGTATFPPQPVFLNSAQNNVVLVANYNSNSVFALNTSANAVTNSAPVGAHPVSLAETPNGLKLYVANQGDTLNPNGSVNSLNTTTTANTTTFSPNSVTGFTGITPVWVVARGDSQKVYVLTQGDGQLVTIDSATDTVTGSLPVGTGANFIFFDPHLNRLYVTNPVSDMVYVFSDTGGANDTPIQLAAISFASGSAPCPAGCAPASVTALPEGSRFYVASYQTASSCPDPVIGTSLACVIAGLSVFDANSFALKLPTLTLLTSPPFAADLATNQYQFAVPPVAACAPITPYNPASTRFRVFTTAAADSSHVYVSMCDAGAIADINTTGSNTNNTGGSGIAADTLVTDLPAPYGVCAQTSCTGVASITAFSITANIVTFQAANAFVPGEIVSVSGLTTGTYLDGVTFTVLSTGLSSAQFEGYSLTPM